MSSAAWKVRVDVGGTFTDCMAWPSDGGPPRRAKVLSTARVRGRILRWQDDVSAETEGFGVPAAGPGHLMLARPDRLEGTRVERYDPETGLLRLSEPVPDRVQGVWELRAAEGAPTLAARVVTRTPFGEALPAAELRLATTWGTNALLEGKTVEPVLFVTAGFEDLLRIGTQERPDLFALDVRRPDPLHAEAVGVPGRVDRRGSVLEPLDEHAVRGAADRLVAAGRKAAAVALLHADVAPEDELRIERILRDAGFAHVSRTSALGRRIGFLARTETAVVDASLAPVIEGYLARIEGEISARRMHVMTSGGGLVPVARYRPKDSLLSGPAAGVRGAVRVARRAGVRLAIAFDMGGTSTDVCRIDVEAPELLPEHRVGAAHIVAPAVPVHTVAAGGGSVCRHDVRGLGVGPESAGADPGPACYGGGGPLALTDVNLLLGRLREEWLVVPVDRAAADRAFARLRAEIPEETDPDTLLEGLVDIANARMAAAIRRVSTERGHDPADHALVAYGGAGGQHACALAGRLGIDTVLVPEDAGVLSAHGLDAADVEAVAERQVLRPLHEIEGDLPGSVAALEREAEDRVRESEGAAEVRLRRVDLRYRGQESTLAVPLDPPATLRRRFEDAYGHLYGHVPEKRVIEVVALRVVAATPAPPDRDRQPERTHRAAAADAVPVRVGGAWREVPVHPRAELEPGAELAGPALIPDRHGVVLVEPGWRASLDGWGTLRIIRVPAVGVAAGDVANGDAPGTTPASRGRAAGRPESVRDELATQRFGAIVEEMGSRLARSAVSVNIRERLDFSCALLDGAGRLVASAPHIPVHLGALGLCVREAVREVPPAPGDVLLTNHPRYGGSHLPDVTVIAPVFEPGHDRPCAYLAARAHHAEIGGRAPGSMPPDATSLAEEGVVLSPGHLVRNGAPLWTLLERALRTADFPSRSPADNLADLEAALAACRFGAMEMERWIAVAGVSEVVSRMRRLTDRAARAVRRALDLRGDGAVGRTEHLDDGTPLSVRITLAGGRAEIDFTGSGGIHPGNLNATSAIVHSVVTYVLRLLADEPLPLNEGLLRGVGLNIPRGILNPLFPDDPRDCPAVVGGNVETSQRLTDAMIGALGLSACSQGTMNNVLFGDERFGYYETIGGGSGAGPSWPGADGTQVHMTNTRITDAEVLEHRYPVRVRRFALRDGSGGLGRFRGGCGLIRELEFTAPADLSLLAQHRTVAPFGCAGGGPGAVGRQYVLRRAGETSVLGGIDRCRVEAGDRLVVETPGGGAWGRSP